LNGLIRLNDLIRLSGLVRLNGLIRWNGLIRPLLIGTSRDAGRLKADHNTENGYPKPQDLPRLSHPAFAPAIIEYGIADLCSIRLMPLPFTPALRAGSMPTNTPILPWLSILATVRTKPWGYPSPGANRGRKKKGGPEKPSF
jgi:hypothetical protein